MRADLPDGSTSSGSNMLTDTSQVEPYIDYYIRQILGEILGATSQAEPYDLKKLDQCKGINLVFYSARRLFKNFYQ